MYLLLVKNHNVLVSRLETEGLKHILEFIDGGEENDGFATENGSTRKEGL